MNLTEAYWELGKEMIPYLRQYTHDLPMIMSLQTYAQCQKLGQVLHKTIRYYVAHYTDFLHLMPFTERDLRVLEIAGRYPFRTGTYRTDFVIDHKKTLRLIEMTTRQPLNGYVISGFTHALAMRKVEEMGLQGVVDSFSRWLKFMQDEFMKSGKVTVVKGQERLGDYKTYAQWFELSDLDFQSVTIQELPRVLDRLSNAAVIEELNHAEICAMPDALIDELCAAGIFNDFRNLFLLHDKRFFALLTQSEFLDCMLNAEEKELLSAYLVPTYTYGLRPDLFDQARRHPEAWILKAVRFGKSEGIYSGQTTGERDWEVLFSSGQAREMVLQPLVDQARFSGMISGPQGKEMRQDFVAGTLLYMDDTFYGPGIYRASSFPVTNVKDDRKMAQVVAQADTRYAEVTL